jgi:hypothetical protein
MIVSVADGERRVGGRVGFDAGEGDAMTTETTMATMMTARASASLISYSTPPFAA